ncbi:GPO family capsid scaffolding protein [Novosphingopyxis sp. YJ-S2-01]|uniref:GPO family capsid scaffolding protein n=1 Tax=Novosphingopyxis sp. YJ-S2-01 TaxID=2794021 RepID=UPI0018DCA59E|nr:GPO family capsid scaffolding protein [Novosphingopyxis sp. YJ-S2-01]MBH9537882.1 GPO family capsid scaffolding protein [Novosphingopyxis sp. YJ-S2-01]
MTNPVTDWTRVAIEGETIDGRRISRQEIIDCAETFSVETLKPRLFVEHLRGVTLDSAFNALGDMVDAKWQEDEVQIGGSPKKVAALYARIEALPPLIEANKQGKKLYTSIEIKANLGGSGRSGLIGLGVTDSPAVLCNQAMRFSALYPKDVSIAAPHEMQFSIAEPAPTADQQEITGMLGEMKKFFSTLAGGKSDDPAPVATPPAPTPRPSPAPASPPTAPGQPSTPETEAFSAAMTGMGGVMEKAFSAITAQLEKSDARMAALEQRLEREPDEKKFSRRPLSTGGRAGGDFVY